MATAGKAGLRERLLAARRAVPGHVRAAEAKALAEHLESVVGDGSLVCAYVPVGAEPGSLELLDVVLRRGGRLLLPIARTEADGTPVPLRWAEYRPGQLVSAAFGLLEPAEPWLPASAPVDADLMLVPALAVDRRGVRLGRGRGFYDRSLIHRNPQAPLVAVLRDDELVDELPAETHDVPVTHALTPRQGLIALGARRES
jgi:5-formyltetrahydrofolate cyclo-ligase